MCNISHASYLMNLNIHSSTDKYSALLTLKCERNIVEWNSPTQSKFPNWTPVCGHLTGTLGPPNVFVIILWPKCLCSFVWKVHKKLYANHINSKFLLIPNPKEDYPATTTITQFTLSRFKFIIHLELTYNYTSFI